MFLCFLHVRRAGARAAFLVNSRSTLCFPVSTDILLPAKMILRLALPSLLLCTKPWPGGHLPPAPLAPLPSSFATLKGVCFALQDEPLTFREHRVAVLWDAPHRLFRCCLSLYSLLYLCLAPVRPLLYLPYVHSRFPGSCNMQGI